MAIVTVYVLNVVAYLAGFPILELPVSLAGVVLAAVVPIALEDANGSWRIGLTGIAVLGVATMQVVDARNTAAEYKHLDAEISSKQMLAYRDQIAKCEASVREKLTLDPRDLLRSLPNGGFGFDILSRRFALRAEALDARLGQGSEAASLARATSEEYRKLSSEFMRARPTYVAIAARLPAPPSKRELQGILDPIAGQFAQDWRSTPLPAFSYHLGLLAIARSHFDEAFGYFYQGVSGDPLGLANYEGLGYYEWAINLNPATASYYAGRGLNQADDEVADVSDDIREVLKSRARGNDDKDLKEFGKSWTKYIEGRREMLSLQRAYYDALLFQDEQPARAIVAGLVASDPTDPDYQDAEGFVLMRFARNDAELRRAQSLFNSALLASDQRVTTQLAAMHLNEATAMLEEVGNQGADTTLQQLRQRCR